MIYLLCPKSYKYLWNYHPSAQSLILYHKSSKFGKLRDLKNTKNKNLLLQKRKKKKKEAPGITQKLQQRTHAPLALPLFFWDMQTGGFCLFLNIWPSVSHQGKGALVLMLHITWKYKKRKCESPTFPLLLLVCTSKSWQRLQAVQEEIWHKF